MLVNLFCDAKRSNDQQNFGKGIGLVGWIMVYLEKVKSRHRQVKRKHDLPKKPFGFPIAQGGIRLHPLPTDPSGDVEQRYRMKPWCLWERKRVTVDRCLRPVGG